MKIKEENKEKLAEALVKLSQSLKNETERCGEMCGGMNEKELTILVFVGQHKNVKMRDIADSIAAPMSSLTTIVDKLVEKSILHRDHSGEDRRVINVSLTTAGKALYAKLVDKKKKTAEAILSSLNDKEQALIIKYLHHLSSVIGTSG